MTRTSRLGAAALGLVLPGLVVLSACSPTVAQPAAPPTSPAVSSPAVSSPGVAPEPEPSGSIWTSTDERLSELISQIEQDHDEADIPGHAGVAVDAQHAALDVWWVGTPPERVQRLVDDPPAGLVVRLHPAAYDYAATSRAVEELMNRYPVIHEASPENDGSGVEVGTTAEGRRSLPSAAVLTQQAGMPVRITISEPPVPA